MAVVKIMVPKYRTDDGKVFDDKEEAEEYDKICNIELLLFDLRDDDYLSNELAAQAIYQFLTKNRDKIIDIMGWENHDGH